MQYTFDNAKFIAFVRKNYPNLAEKSDNEILKINHDWIKKINRKVFHEQDFDVCKTFHGIVMNREWCVANIDWIESLAWNIHDYLKNHAIGKQNAISAKTLCEHYNAIHSFTTTPRIIRRCREFINNSHNAAQKKILTSSKGYYIAAGSIEEIHKQYENTAFRKIAQGVAQIKEGRALLKQINLDNTTRLKLTEYMKEIVEIGIKQESE